MAFVLDRTHERYQLQHTQCCCSGSVSDTILTVSDRVTEPDTATKPSPVKPDRFRMTELQWSQAALFRIVFQHVSVALHASSQAERLPLQEIRLVDSTRLDSIRLSVPPAHPTRNCSRLNLFNVRSIWNHMVNAITPLWVMGSKPMCLFIAVPATAHSDFTLSITTQCVPRNTFFSVYKVSVVTSYLQQAMLPKNVLCVWRGLWYWDSGSHRTLKTASTTILSSGIWRREVW